MPTSVSFDGSGYIYDAFGNIRAVPDKTQTAYYPLASKAGSATVVGPNDVGFRFRDSNITIYAGALAVGDIINVVVTGSSTVTITPGSGVTFRLAGSATTGARTVANYGIASVLCVDTDTYVISGGGVS